MKVDVESVSSVEKKLEVFIPAEEVKEKLEAVVKELQKNAKIRGFRPGKIPRNVIESMYKEEILKEVSSRLVSESFENALNEVAVTPVSRPNITQDKVETDRDFHYSASFEVIPEFEVRDYTGIELKKEKHGLKEEDVEQALNRLRERETEAKPLEEEREVRKGDYAVVDYEGFLDEKPVKGLKGSDVQLLVGEGRLIAEFEDNLPGMRAGEERQFEVTYPEDFALREVAGKTVNFNLRVKNMLQRILPELDDEFAKDLGRENLEDLREMIRGDLAKKLEDQSQAKLREDIVKSLLERNTFEVPPSLVQSELLRMERELMMNFERRGLEVPPLGEEAHGRFRERAERNVQISIIFSEIAKKEGIKVTEEEINKKLLEIAASYQVPFDKLKEVYKNNNMMAGIEAGLVEDKVFEFLLEKSVIEEASEEQI